MVVRKSIEVGGIVQGVGFRPYVYRLARERGLAGTICNTAGGVTIEVQGPEPAVADFIARLPSEAPALARITGIGVRGLPLNGDDAFQILVSRGGEHRALISPDVAVCGDCLRELRDPADRRYRYPFINCTNCGPRYTIVRDIPYDRPLTSMAVFPMCDDCRREYDDPLDRRFHAQPNACWRCGPRVEWWPGDSHDPLGDARAALHAGKIVAVKGLGGFHLACDATNAAAVEELRRRKRRVEKPFAVMVPDIATAERLCMVDAGSRRLLESPQRPIVLMPRATSLLPDAVAPGNRDLGLFLPYTPLHYLLLEGFTALVMTSGNRSEEPIAIGNEEALRRLAGLADYFLLHNRAILLRSDDSVLRVAAGLPRQLRRSRGYVPFPVILDRELTPGLAAGGELKNTICLTKGPHAFLSQHIGDLENAESYAFFEEVVEHLTRILEIRPQWIAYDLHPGYFSTQWALKQEGLPRIGVQHHHAHIAACMAENHLPPEARVIGIALDGTGYGTDGHIWGGEILLAGYASFERLAHLPYVPMPGGEAAIREPWRMAAAYIAQHFGGDLAARVFNSQATRVLLRMMERGVNSPLTSSCGRLFDAVSALAGIRQRVNYEAQAAIELEMALEPGGDDAYRFEWTDTRPLFASLMDDWRRRTSAGVISRRFHNGVVQALAAQAWRAREQTGVAAVCLSGGTFHNVYLLERLSARLAADGFQVLTHREVPCGDGGLSLGQAMVAQAAVSRG